MRFDRGISSVLAVLLLLLAVAAAVGWRLRAEGGANPSPAARPELPSTEGVEVASIDLFEESRPVQGSLVVRDTLWIQVVASGEASASRRSEVATRTEGVVQSVQVQEGDAVLAGDLLVQLDTAQATMNLIRARTALTRAQAQYDQRMLQVGQAGAWLSAEEREARARVVRAETGLAEAELALVEREMALELTRVRAPFAGHVADLQAVEGAFLNSGGAVLTLVQLDPIQVAVDVLEGEIGLLSVGRSATVRFSALGGELLGGTVESINPRVDQHTRAGRVTLTLSNPEGRILPGSYAWVSLDAEPFPDRILVPREAITTRGERHREVVFLLKDSDGEGGGTAEWNYVAVGRRNDRWVEIVPTEDTSMPEPGDIVLVAGHHYLAHGTRVHGVDVGALTEATPER